MAKDFIYRFTILGCGSSPGVPRIMGDWGACDPQNPKNNRMRSALLIERIKDTGQKTTIVVDTGPDFRQQMLMANVKYIDAVVYTHGHADHTHGIDDLRPYAFEQKDKIAVYADFTTLEKLRESFGYCFSTPAGSNYPPILMAHQIADGEEFSIQGAAGEISLLPLLQHHGNSLSLGFRIGDVAYCTDVSHFPDETVENLKGLDVLILDCLQYKPHPSHLSLEQALSWIEKLKPKKG